MPSGGYRKPTNPAPVSGPGALSRRTDGGPSDPNPKRVTGDGSYGESAELQELQGGAEMHRDAPPSFDPSMATPVNAPSARPDEPVTFGADAGAGAGSEALGLPGDDADVRALAAYLPMLERLANSPNATPSTRAFVRRIKSRL